jgi:hypothetical protein
LIAVAASAESALRAFRRFFGGDVDFTAGCSSWTMRLGAAAAAEPTIMSSIVPPTMGPEVFDG